MAFFLYNIIQAVALLFLWPIILLIALCVPKYRGRIWSRLGAGLAQRSLPVNRPKIWIHALSVGESASARPLIEALKRQDPNVCILFSTTTRGGEEYAASFQELVDVFLPFPLDILPVVLLFLKRIKPDLFILVETDFWPNLLSQLARLKIPAYLVNGRITESSVRRYGHVRFLFRSLFDSFQLIFTQTERDQMNIVRLGASQNKVFNHGNLKYDLSLGDLQQKEAAAFCRDLTLPADKPVIVAGSTHPGEEELVLDAVVSLKKEGVDPFVIIAPRDTSRGTSVAKYATSKGFAPCLRSATPGQTERSVVDLLVLDTLGELRSAYLLADIVFVGGSLVDEGGHNPLEPACAGKPVVNGPSFSDFQEITTLLLEAGALVLCEDAQSLSSCFRDILLDEERKRLMGQRGADVVRQHQGAAERIAAQILGECR